MEDQKKGNENQKSSPLFDATIGWKVITQFLRPGELDVLNERMDALSKDQNPDALKEIYLLGFRAGVFFTQDTYEKERQK